MAKQSIINEGIVDTSEPMSNINVTSLVDVMFCLLIMFMVATPLIEQDETGVVLPAARAEKIEKEEGLYTVISIDRKGQHFLGGMALSADPEKLKVEISQNATLSEQGMVFVQADKNVEHGKIVDLLIMLKDANVQEVGFVTDPNLKRIKQERGE